LQLKDSSGSGGMARMVETRTAAIARATWRKWCGRVFSDATVRVIAFVVRPDETTLEQIPFSSFPQNRAVVAAWCAVT
jgi:hypothetical protein